MVGTVGDCSSLKISQRAATTAEQVECDVVEGRGQVKREWTTQVGDVDTELGASRVNNLGSMSICRCRRFISLLFHMDISSRS